MTVAYAEPLTAELDPARQFDFWLGEWDCSWSDGDGNEGGATNTVYLDLDGRVIVESFDARPFSDYQGMSFSMYDPVLGRWRQTWVDNAWPLPRLSPAATRTGSWTSVTTASTTALAAEFRALWHSIERDRLGWAWQRSLDDGETWTTLWAMEYVRVL